MKKNIVSILIIGIIAMVSMSFLSSSVSANGSGSGSISIVKGQLITSNHGRTYEGVTFGLRGFKPGDNRVTSVRIFDIQGKLVGEVFNFDMDYSRGAFWFEVDFNGFKVPKEFTIEVHVSNRKGGGSVTLNSLNAMSTGIDPTGPIDPDETILIVRYP